jgi:hypothetical protein
VASPEGSRRNSCGDRLGGKRRAILKTLPSFPEEVIVWLKCLFLLSGAAVLFCTTWAVGQGEQGPVTLEKVLTAPGLWGKDFPKALASLPDWQQSNVDRLAVFHKQIVSATPAATADQHTVRVNRLTTVMKNNRPRSSQKYSALLKTVAPEGQSGLKMEQINSFKDDQKPRVALTADQPQFLAPGVDLATVEERLGKAEKVDTLTIPTEGDRRPVVLKQYHYANGSVIFATSDLTPAPKGQAAKKPVDRAILNVAKVMTEVFPEAQQ